MACVQLVAEPHYGAESKPFLEESDPTHVWVQSGMSEPSAGHQLCDAREFVASFLTVSEVARLSLTNMALRLDITVEASNGHRLLRVPFLDLNTYIVDVLDNLSLPHVRTLRTFQQLPFQTLLEKVSSDGPDSLGSLERLTCKGCRMDCKIVRSQLVPLLIPPERNLKLLNLERNRIDDALLKELCATGVLERIETLNLRFNEISDEGIQAVAATPGASRLKWLNLKMNRIGDAGGAALATLIARPGCCISLLNLRRQMPGLTDRTAQEFAEALKTNSSLQQLRLRRNRISDDGATALAKAVEDMVVRKYRACSLIEDVRFELDLEENRVKTQGALTLLRTASSIPKAARIEFLLAGNKDGVEPLSRERLQAEHGSLVDALNPRVWFESKPEADL